MSRRWFDFAAEWDRRDPLLIHCYAGVSRSTAAAYAVACALQPEADELALAAALRAASPSATPNPRIVALADSHLGRQGRMVAAIQVDRPGRRMFRRRCFCPAGAIGGLIPCGTLRAVRAIGLVTFGASQRN